LKDPINLFDVLNLFENTINIVFYSFSVLQYFFRLLIFVDLIPAFMHFFITMFWLPFDHHSFALNLSPEYSLAFLVRGCDEQIFKSPFPFDSEQPLIFFVEGLLDLKSCGVLLRPVRAGIHDILRLQVDGVHVNDPIRSFPSRTELAEKLLTYSKVAGSFPTKAGGPRLSQKLFVESFVLSDQLRKMHIVY
jgi:hypothetical protein